MRRGRRESGSRPRPSVAAAKRRVTASFLVRAGFFPHSEERTRWFVCMRPRGQKRGSKIGGEGGEGAPGRESARGPFHGTRRGQGRPRIHPLDSMSASFSGVVPCVVCAGEAVRGVRGRWAGWVSRLRGEITRGKAATGVADPFELEKVVPSRSTSGVSIFPTRRDVGARTPCEGAKRQPQRGRGPVVLPHKTWFVNIHEFTRNRTQQRHQTTPTTTTTTTWRGEKGDEKPHIRVGRP